MTCHQCDDDDWHCGVCGEHMKHNGYLPLVEVGEFVNESGEHIIAHAECGVSHGLEMA